MPAARTVQIPYIEHAPPEVQLAALRRISESGEIWGRKPVSVGIAVPSPSSDLLRRSPLLQRTAYTIPELDLEVWVARYSGAAATLHREWCLAIETGIHEKMPLQEQLRILHVFQPQINSYRVAAVCFLAEQGEERLWGKDDAPAILEALSAETIDEIVARSNWRGEAVTADTLIPFTRDGLKLCDAWLSASSTFTDCPPEISTLQEETRNWISRSPLSS